MSSYENEIHRQMKIMYDDLKSQREYENDEHNFCIALKVDSWALDVDLRLGVLENFKRLKKASDNTLDEYTLYWKIYDCFDQVASESKKERYYDDEFTRALAMGELQKEMHSKDWEVKSNEQRKES